MNALVYVNIDQGIHKVKFKVALNEKRKNLHGISFSIKTFYFSRVVHSVRLKNVRAWSGLLGHPKHTQVVVMPYARSRPPIPKKLAASIGVIYGIINDH